MSKLHIAPVLALALLAATSCSSGYKVVSISRSRILIDSRYDRPEPQAEAFLSPYSKEVDSVMSPVVGSIARNMTAAKPESEESNLLADIMVWGGKFYGEKPDFGLYNMGGIRAAFSKGKVTYGDVLDVAPFENKICFFNLRGDRVLELFQQIAAVGGEGVSHSLRLKITRDGRLLSATINGEPVDPSKEYRVATLDYLAQGNDHLDALKLKTDVNSPTDEQSNSRYVICKYFEEQAAEGKAVDSQVEGRIVITE